MWMTSFQLQPWRNTEMTPIHWITSNLQNIKLFKAECEGGESVCVHDECQKPEKTFYAPFSCAILLVQKEFHKVLLMVRYESTASRWSHIQLILSVR